MNKEQAKKILPVMQAYVDGKQIQHRWRGDTQWHDTVLDSVSFESAEEYRIKPEPKLRAWKEASEVDLDATYRHENGQESLYRIMYADPQGVVLLYKPTGVRPIESAHESYTALAKWYRRTNDNGKTWHPCGVMEEQL